MALKQAQFVGSLDCGTTSTRFIIFDEYANVIAQHQLEFNQYYPHPGWHEHDPAELVQVSHSVIDGAIHKLENDLGFSRESIKAIGITNQRETTVAWSRKTGKALCNAIVWDDGRTGGVVRHFEKKLSEEGLVVEGKTYKGDEGTRKLKDLCGLPLSTYFSAIKLVWMLEHHEAVKKAHDEDDLLMGTVESWVVYNMTPENLHISDPTNASRTLLLDIHALKWSEPLLAFFGLKSSILPRLVSSCEVFGTLKDGALKGVKIAGLVGDQQGALVGNKCLGKGEAKCTYGTGAFLLFCTGGEVVRSENGLIGTVAYQAGPGAKPVYALEGSISVAGSAIKWLRDSMGLIKSASEVNTLAAKAQAQNKDGGESGVYFVTAFAGLLAPYWDPRAGGMIIGLSSYTTPAHIALATIEASAFQTKAIIESMGKDSGVDLKHLKVDGGMTEGDVVMQVLSDVGGFEVIRPEMRESTALGSALLAGSALKLFGWDITDPATLSKVNTKGSTSFNSKINEVEREKKWKGWCRAVERSKGWGSVEEE